MDKFVTTAEGNHSMSIGVVMTPVAKFKDLTVLQLDTHSDLRHEYEGSMFNHAMCNGQIKGACSACTVGNKGHEQ